jgi:hypothetical protein
MGAKQKDRDENTEEHIRSLGSSRLEFDGSRGTYTNFIDESRTQKPSPYMVNPNHQRSRSITVPVVSGVQRAVAPGVR